MFNFDSVVIVGAGGTGSYLLPPLIRFLNSKEFPGKIIIIDGDKYDEGNVSRQEFAHSLVGQNKAEVQAEVFAKKYPYLNFYPVAEYLGNDNIAGYIQNNSVVFCCVDNHVARNLMSKHCQKLENTLLVSGGNEETDGNVQYYLRENGQNVIDPIEKRHPEIEKTNDGDRSEMSCEELAHLPSGGQIIFTNLFSATLMCCVFYGVMSGKMKDVNDIFFDIQIVKTRRVVNGKPE